MKLSWTLHFCRAHSQNYVKKGLNLVLNGIKYSSNTGLNKPIVTEKNIISYEITSTSYYCMLLNERGGYSLFLLQTIIRAKFSNSILCKRSHYIA